MEDKKQYLLNNEKKYILYATFSDLLILGPILTLFFIHKGLSFTQIFTIGAVNSLFVVLFEVPTGAVADRYSRKLSIIIGCILWIVSLNIYIYAQHFYVFIIGEILFSIGMTFKSGAEDALLYDSLIATGREMEFTRIKGRARSYFLYASAIGSLLASFVYTQNIYYPFIISIGFIVISLIIALTFTEPDQSKAHLHEAKDYKAIIQKSSKIIVSNRKVLNVVIFSTITFVFMRMAYPFYQPHMVQSGMDIKYLGIVFFLFNIVAAFSAKNAEKFIKFTKPMSMFWVGTLVALSYFLLGTVHFTFSFIFIFLQQITRGLGNPVFSKYINKNIPSDYRATIMSFNSLLGNIGVIVLQPFLGYLIDHFSIFPVEFGVGVLMLSLLILFEINVRARERA